MKIIVVENNFRPGIDSAGPQPFFYLKPDVSIIRNNQPVYYPVPPEKLIFSLNIVIIINRLGKTINKKFAFRYFNELSLAANFIIKDENNFNITGRDSRENITLFDNSIQIGNWVEKKTFSDFNDINCCLYINDRKISVPGTSHFLMNIDEFIEFVSKYLTIKMGDLILSSFTGIIDNFKPGDRIKASAENLNLLDFMIK